MRKPVIGLAAVLLLASPAFADIAVTPGSGANLIDFTGTTTPAGTSRCAGGSPVNHCAATAIIDTAGLPVTGVAGTPSTSALTVQGIASGTPVVVSGSGNFTVVGTGTLAVQAAQSGTWNIGTVATITNPVNLGTIGPAATAANQGIANSSLATIASNTGTYLGGFSTAQTSAVANNLVAKASPGDIISISGSGASGSFIMLFDATSAPADGAVTPKKCWGPFSAAGPFVFGWGSGPVLHNATGITVVSSSTGCFTKTGVNAPFISVEFN